MKYPLHMRYYLKCKLNPNDRQKLCDSLKNGTLGIGTVLQEGMQTALRGATIDDDGDVVHFIEVCYCLEYSLHPMAMESRDNNNHMKSLELEAAIAEPILMACLEGCSICELSCKAQAMLPLPYTVLKKYIFHLINYELLSYNGQRQVYVTEEGGLDLLYLINKEKKMAMVNSEDIVITIG